MDLAKAERFSDALQGGRLSAEGEEAYILLCLSMDYAPGWWRLSKASPSPAQAPSRTFLYAGLQSWRDQVDATGEAIFSACAEVEDNRPRIHFDLRQLVNPSLFFDSLR